MTEYFKKDGQIVEDLYKEEFAYEIYTKLKDLSEDSTVALELSKAIILAEAIKAPLYNIRPIPGAGVATVEAGDRISDAIIGLAGELADIARAIG